MTHEDSLRDTKPSTIDQSPVSTPMGSNALQTRQDGPQRTQPLGWVIQCPRCGHHRTVHRDDIMAGTWLTCPRCEGSSTDGPR